MAYENVFTELSAAEVPFELVRVRSNFSESAKVGPAGLRSVTSEAKMVRSKAAVVALYCTGCCMICDDPDAKTRVMES
jgi:hypothetical protein